MLFLTWLVICLSLLSMFLTRKKFLIVRIPALIAFTTTPPLVQIVTSGQVNDWQGLVVCIFLLSFTVYGFFSVGVQLIKHGFLHKQGADAEFVIYAQTTKKIKPL